VKARKVKKLDPSAPLRENAGRIVRVRLAELRSFLPVALEEDQTTAQHDMRIAAKRLRYVLELTEECFGSSGGESRKQARQLQRVLGDMHDCDVLLPLLERRLSRGSDRGLELIVSRLEARRRELLDDFRALCAEQERAEGVWERLDRAAASAAGANSAASLGNRV